MKSYLYVHNICHAAITDVSTWLYFYARVCMCWKCLIVTAVFVFADIWDDAVRSLMDEKVWPLVRRQWRRRSRQQQWQTAQTEKLRSKGSHLPSLFSHQSIREANRWLGWLAAEAAAEAEALRRFGDFVSVSKGRACNHCLSFPPCTPLLCVSRAISRRWRPDCMMDRLVAPPPSLNRRAAEDRHQDNDGIVIRKKVADDGDKHRLYITASAHFLLSGCCCCCCCCFHTPI